ncbi:MAG: tetratricopeptide repeat protein [Saprospiraceae bacterium]|nr:tetratricopeptide repeat protein [Candidatus Vicinibacter affinis]
MKSWKRQKSDIYSNTDTVVKGMMEAVALESNKMNMEALNTYDKTLSQYPENKLLRMLYAAFCVRMGQYAKAKMIMEK